MRRVAGMLAVTALLCVALTGCAAREAFAPRSGPAGGAAKMTTPEGANMKTIYLAGGCFWGLEKYVGLVRGVVGTEVGYANGKRDGATYQDGSGYAEVVKIAYDPAVAPLPFLLDLYYDAIDPTSVNRQGNDVGVDYRTGIYYTDPADEPVIRESIARLQKDYSEPIAIEVGPLVRYSPAEEYHQDYLDKNPGGYCHIPRKLFDAARAARPE